MTCVVSAAEGVPVYRSHVAKYTTLIYSRITNITSLNYVTANGLTRDQHQFEFDGLYLI